MMHVRFLRLLFRAGAVPEFVRIYDERILATLSATEGCLGAALLTRARRDEEVLSLTAWRGAGHAIAYDEGGSFARLLNLTEHLLDESPNGRATLAPEHDLAVESYDADLLPPTTLADALVPGRFARTVAVDLALEGADVFDRRYRAETSLAREDFPGLSAALLLRHTGQPSRVVGVGFWRGEEDAARYELSGRFDRLAESLGDTLSTSSGWLARFSSGPTPPPARAAFVVAGWFVRLARAF